MVTFARAPGLPVRLAALLLAAVVTAGCSAGRAADPGTSPSSGDGAAPTPGATSTQPPTTPSAPGRDGGDLADRRVAEAALERAGVAGLVDPGYRVVRGRSTVVVGTAATARLETYSRRADLAVDKVGTVWRHPWAPPLLVLAPFGEAEFERLAGEPRTGDLHYVTVQPPGGLPYVVVDDNVRGVPPEAALQAAMTHEAFHAMSSQSATRQPPTWLVEGTAEYVGERFSPGGRWNLPEAWRALPAPSRLPTAADFEADPEAAYFRSWSACLFIADTWGAAKLFTLYDRLQQERAGDVDHVFRRVLGEPIPQFVRVWQTWVRQKARTAGQKPGAARSPAS